VARNNYDFWRPLAYIPYLCYGKNKADKRETKDKIQDEHQEYLLAIPGYLRSNTCIAGGPAKVSEDTFLVVPTERSVQILTGLKGRIYIVETATSNDSERSIACKSNEWKTAIHTAEGETNVTS